MELARNCLVCGGAFLGRPNRVYCSMTCKTAEKRRRKRVRELRDHLAHAERQVELAVVSGRAEQLRIWRWRLEHLKREEAALQPFKEGSKKGPKEGSAQGAIVTLSGVGSSCI